MEVSFIQKYFVPKSILDIGAHRGDFYALCKAHYPEAYFYLVEANPECENLLKSLNVDYYICPMSDTIKQVKFYTNKTDSISTGNSLYRENTHHFAENNITVLDMTTTTLDEHFGSRTFDFIKIDVQGSELDIIRGGMSNVIPNAKGILLETSLTEYNVSAPLEDEVIAYMTSIGYTVAEIVDNHYDTSGNIFQRDVFFLNSRI